MHAVDTDVVIRFLILDDASQSPLVRDFIKTHEVLALSTVLLECEWVMRSMYRLPAPGIARLLRAFVGLDTVTAERPEILFNALDWFEQGMDFADAMHLAASDGCQALATFDRKLATAADKVGAGTIRLL